MESLLNNYFTIIENLYRIKILSQNNIRRVLMLLYFPIMILSLIYTNSGILSSILIFSMVILSPILILPAILNKIFIVFRNLNYNINRFQFEYEVDNSFTATNIDYHFSKTNDIENTFIFKLFDKNFISYEPRKIKSKKVINKLRIFYNEKSNEYFEKLDYERDFFIDLIFKNKTLSLNERIKLDSDLKGASIKLLLKELKQITGIYEKELAKLFYIETNSDRLKNINIKSINSAYSQLDTNE